MARTTHGNHTTRKKVQSRFNVWYTPEPKKKNRPEVIKTVSSIFGDFCFRTFVPHIERCYYSRHRGVSCPVAATLSGRS